MVFQFPYAEIHLTSFFLQLHCLQLVATISFTIAAYESEQLLRSHSVKCCNWLITINPYHVSIVPGAQRHALQQYPVLGLEIDRYPVYTSVISRLRVGFALNHLSY